MEALVSRRVGCRATASDLVQELFLRFWRRPQVKVEALDTYLLRCAGNLAIDHLRSEGSRVRAAEGLRTLDAAAAVQAPEHVLEVDHDLQRIEAALLGLPERTRQIFLRNRIHGHTYSEIAEALQLSRSAVEKHMMRALQACKTSVAEPASSPRRALRYAAACLVLVLAWGTAAGWHPGFWLQDLQADYVSNERVRQVTLADRSQLTLDAGTALAVDFEHGERRVRLLRGAAYFQVTHTGEPFLVEAGGGEVRVVGTAFEVREQEDGAQVTVLGGRVAVTPSAGQVPRLLTANQQIAYAHGQAGETLTVDSEARLGWRQGWLNYYQVPLKTVVEDLRRYYPGRILLLDAELGQRKVSGSFPVDDPMAALDSLGAVLGFERQTVWGRVTVLR
ncbi:MAG TPA: sigma-70 family RNA polymerase sigma factor [Pseudomonas sp.]|uniref:sigma-70 family RNA polymerase sigma factor n=1 Tax=Pseudomonas sp. TaxID=306 RepID=UPI002B4951E8|nr:sigma-70 family RNA polymerase sigma factor [Pseudomonas sp.]HKS13198.1 sigma-70 family RNA polymerase sigma factor [Pseudomonas sp.]